MNTKQPIHLYKYQSGSDESILNLLTCTAVMSSRKIFNDPYDSQARFIEPKPDDLYAYLSSKGSDATRIANDIINCNGYTENGRKYIDGLRTGINKMLDSFAIYCLSSKPNDILMWSHYANSHKGFCIEYKPNYIPAHYCPKQVFHLAA